MEHKIWIEKYRPKTFSEIKGQTEIISRLKAFVEQKNMPHLLFSGPAGVGKSTTALVIAKELFGETWKQNFLELNASDERGIDVVRVKVKDFARTRAIGDVPFKIIFLDECDALTKDAQQALRRTMENFTLTTRFILSANYSSKIIDPIQSRCALFRYKPLKEEDVFSLIDYIIEKEQITVTEEAKKAIVEVSNGDCRRIENILQSSAAISNNVDAESIYSIASVAKPKEVKEFLTLAINNNFIESRNMLLKVMLNYGLSGLDLIKQIQREIWNLDIDDKTKTSLVAYCGEVEFRLVEGSDDFVQLEALLSKFVLAKD